MENMYNNLEKMRVSLKSLLLFLSNTQMFLAAGLPDHHQQVAYLSYHLGKAYGLPFESLKQTFLAALVHDIGALSLSEHMELDMIEIVPDFDSNHATKGASLISSFAPFKNLAPIVKYHHYPWMHGKGTEYKGEEVPFESHVIQLADNISIRFGKEKFIMKKKQEILDFLEKGRGELYVPELVDSFKTLVDQDHLWLDFSNEHPVEQINDGDLFGSIVLDSDEIVSFTKMISQIIDFRSRFTARHSAGVAACAYRLAKFFNFSELEQKMMLIAGYLHDLGKIAVSNDILEKQGKLTAEEMIEMRSHTYYTAKMLNTIPQFATINQWASLHHERLDGKGYPFQYSADTLPLGSRIMAVADVFTAITEHRPYREGLSKETATNILTNMVSNGGLDENVVKMMIKHYDDINHLRIKAQDEALEKFEEFMTW